MGVCNKVFRSQTGFVAANREEILIAALKRRWYMAVIKITDGCGFLLLKVTRLYILTTDTHAIFL
jgi:hypothetical protein